jgi:hypothetical protein
MRFAIPPYELQPLFAIASDFYFRRTSLLAPVLPNALLSPGDIAASP